MYSGRCFSRNFRMPARDVLGPGVDVRPQHDGRHLQLVQRHAASRRSAASPSPYSVVTGCWLTSRNGLSSVMCAPTPSRSSQSADSRCPLPRAISATRSMRGHPTTCTVAGSSPIRMMRSAACWFAGKCRCASLVTACRMLSSMVPLISPPIVCATRNVHVRRRDRRRHRLEPVADADDDVGLQHARTSSAARAGRGRSTSPSCAGVSPSTIIVTLASGVEAVAPRSRRPPSRTDRAAPRRRRRAAASGPDGAAPHASPT